MKVTKSIKCISERFMVKHSLSLIHVFNYELYGGIAQPIAS